MSTDTGRVRWIRSRESGESETKNRVLSDSLSAFRCLRDFQFWVRGMHLRFLQFSTKIGYVHLSGDIESPQPTSDLWLL